MNDDALKSLTARQIEILRLIESHVQESGFPPTRAEICSAMGFSSPNAAETHLRALARKGVIEMTSGASRGIRLVQDLSQLPVIGRVAAGSPMLAEENVEQRYRVDPALFNPAAYAQQIVGGRIEQCRINTIALFDIFLGEHGTAGCHTADDR